MGSRAHATMLAAQKLITYADLDAILKGLDEVSVHARLANVAWPAV
jgi:argininosuccinate lyase